MVWEREKYMSEHAITTENTYDCDMCLEHNLSVIYFRDGMEMCKECYDNLYAKQDMKENGLVGSGDDPITGDMRKCGACGHLSDFNELVDVRFPEGITKYMCFDCYCNYDVADYSG
jgi:hypothetical protein